MAEQADSGDKRKRRLGVVMGRRAARKKTQTDNSLRVTRASTQRSQNKEPK